MYDIAILNGTIVEPKTRLQTVANVGIKDGRIETVSREKLECKEMIDAADKIVCPGFIDIHCHLDSKSVYRAWLAAKQGITTCLSGNCGITEMLPVKDYLDLMEKQGYPINWGVLVGHSWTLRETVGITSPYDAATPKQTAEMAKLADEALKQGAFGVSFGLEYSPGASFEECLPLCQLAAMYDKLVPIHVRTDALDFAKGLREAIRLMEKTGARIHIAHLAGMFTLYPDVTDMALRMIQNNVDKGMPISCDSGVYEAFMTHIQSPVFDQGWQERYNCALEDMIVSSGKFAGQRCTPEIYEYIRTKEEETMGTAIVGIMPDIIKSIQQPYTMISTDAGQIGGPGEGHPQDAGTFPRVFQKLVREYGALSMMDAVYKSTYMPALQMGIADRKGWLGTGADADIVVFDPRTIADNADYLGLGNPTEGPAGIEQVIVNGVSVVSDGKASEDRLPGQILRQPNKVWSI